MTRFMPRNSLRFFRGLCLILGLNGVLQGVFGQVFLTNGLALDSLLQAGGRASFFVDANAGDAITVQVAKLSGGAAFAPSIAFLTEDGFRLASDSGAVVARVDTQAPTKGVYTLIVSDSTGSGSGEFRICLARTPGTFVVAEGDDGGPLTNGMVTHGVIGLGDLDQWTISANEGDRLIFQLSETSGGAAFIPCMEVFAPDGSRLAIASHQTVARADIQAASTGVYTVMARDRDKAGSGSYQMQAVRAPGTISVPDGDEGGHLADAMEVAGEITAGDLDLFSFDATAGELLSLRLSETSGGAGFRPQLELFGPSGQLKGISRDPSLATVDVAAEESGNYTVLVSDGDQIGAGSYQLFLSRASLGAGGPSFLTNGVSLVGSVSTVGETNRWSFAASAGDSIVVRVGETASTPFVPWVRLLNPAGAVVRQDFSAAAAEVTARATNSGLFTVLVSDGSNPRNQTGDYRITLAKTGSDRISELPNGEGGTLPPGLSYLAAIETGGIHSWSFLANTGESIVVRAGEAVSGSSLLPWLRLYGPNGALINADFGAAAAEVAVRATNSGVFLVVMGDGNNNLAGTGNYRISLTKSGVQPVIGSLDEGGPLTNGITYVAAIETGDADAWTFTANPGENILVRAGETIAGSSLLPWLRLYGPNGALLSSDFGAAAAEVGARATNAGVFLVVVADGNSGYFGTGNYRISLARTYSVPEISTGDEGGTLTNGLTYVAAIEAGDLDAWAFTAEVGESIVIRTGETTSGSSLTPWLRLYGPSGALLGADFGAAAAEVATRATNSGQFLAVIGDGSNGRAGVGNYRISMAKTGGELKISSGDEGGPLVNGLAAIASISTGDIDAWTFTANLGDSIVLRAGEAAGAGGLTPWLRLYGPDGAFLGADFGSAAAEVAIRATNSGTFLVVASDGSNGLGGSANYRLGLVKSGSPLVAPSDGEGGPMSGTNEYYGAITAGELDAYSFTACAGDPLTFAITEQPSGVALVPWLRLYGRDGVLLKSASGSASAAIKTFYAPHGGTYTLVVGDGSNGLSGTGSYHLTVNGLSTGLKLCAPLLSGQDAVIQAVGGEPAGQFVLLTATNVAAPLGEWTPLQTNQFSEFGVMHFTNSTSGEPWRFFSIQTP